MRIQDKNIKTIVCESRTGRNIRPVYRDLFMDNHRYGLFFTTFDVLKDLRSFVANDCKLDY